MTGSGYHVPVLLAEVVALMSAAPAGALVDGTLGGGGHLAALGSANDNRVLVGIDQDPDALAEAVKRDPLRSAKMVQGNFRDLDRHIATALGPGAKVAGILLDLGVSSWQLDADHRGFAIRFPKAPLDMRMGPRDQSGETAKDLVLRLEHGPLANILHSYGEVPKAGVLASRLKEAAWNGKLETTGDLVRVVESMRNDFRALKVHPATLVAQALRIAVNDELGALDDALAKAPDVLLPGGRLVVISYHSLEDRRVKQAFHLGEHGPERPAKLPPPSDWKPTWKVLTKVVTASDAEVQQNPRSRSAKLRAAAREPVPAGVRA